MSDKDYSDIIALLEQRAQVLKPDPELIEQAIKRCERYQMAHGSSNDVEESVDEDPVDNTPAEANGHVAAEPAMAMTRDSSVIEAPSEAIASAESAADALGLEDSQHPEDDGLSVANTVEESRRTAEQLEQHRQVAEKHKQKKSASHKRKLLKPDTEIQGYRILGLLGKGGMGQVYRAMQMSMNREVAFKVLSPRFAKSKSFRTRFLREAHSAGRLHHRHLIAVHDVDETPDGMLFFSMELVEGRSVADIIDEDGPMDELESVRIIKQTLEALAYAHERNVIHRDIKPDNIMLDGEGAVKVADLGLSRIDEEGEKDGRVTAANTMMGTPYYMSPEQSRDAHTVDHRTDLYSVGATLYHMICGEVPFDGETPLDVVVAASTEKLEFIDPQPSTGIKRFIQVMMAKNPDQRPENARAALDILQRLEANPKASISPTNSTKILISIAIIVLIIMLIIVAAMSNTPEPIPEEEPPRRTQAADSNDARSTPVLESSNILSKFYYDVGEATPASGNFLQFNGEGHGVLKYTDVAELGQRQVFRLHLQGALRRERNVVVLQLQTQKARRNGPRMRSAGSAIIISPRGILFTEQANFLERMRGDRADERSDQMENLGWVKQDQGIIEIVTDGQRATITLLGHEDKRVSLHLKEPIQSFDLRWSLKSPLLAIMEVDGDIER